MIKADFERYEAYKDSGVEWIGTVPDHWFLRHFKRFATMKGRIGWQGLKYSEFTDEGPFLITGMNFKGGKINWDEVYHISEKRYQQAPEIQLKNHDILMTKDGTIGKLLYVNNIPAPYKASLNSHLLVFRPIKESYYPKFLYYQLDSTIFNKYTHIAKTGTTFFGISQTAVGQYIGLLPPLPEQKVIAKYLDSKTALIDRKIELLTQKASLYENLKKSLINETVTKGLDKSVKMKDSGIDWIGEVPEHWVFNRHKDNFIFITKTCTDPTLYKVGLENIEGKTGRFIATNSDFEGNGIEFKINDILFGKLRPYLAKVYLAEFKGNAVGDIFVYRTKYNMIPKFAQYLMLSNKYLDVINNSTAGAKMPRVSSSFIANLIIATPPISEQKAIAQFLDTKTTKIDQIVKTINIKIDNLKELRKTLINDVVTGKIKVVK
ncbi:Type I restriction endonuclease domain-containing protein [Desulfonema limicola]|uniref:Type I restriction endonuclease domain-containing protein n=1 Tax=Desulfonema limicola TaxID=45656 RepID=A0A975BBK1_9BACT|nr:restriction endonuclease subunit S [Desulfonema limicola]QTA82352.1 Type I restriction endonuclease domain-containing protein [Desulfonema limicola]